jgi:hypothetical protein
MISKAKTLLNRILIVSLSLGVASCSTVNAPDPDTDTAATAAAVARSFSSERLYTPNEVPKCKAMLDSYCDTLYSPEAQGNLEIKRSTASSAPSISVLQGETQNEFSQVFYRYAQAKLNSRSSLPTDFRNALERNSYFTKLRVYLNRPPRAKMSLSQRLESENMNFELGSIWNAAMNEVILSRMSSSFPGYHKIRENNLPIELQLERRRLRRDLISEISKSVWGRDKNWQKVVQGFERLKISFLRMIPQLDIPKDVVTDWSDRIREVQLALPGSSPAISDEECSATTANAYYYTYLNILTVCAGDFNSVDILQTLAHEMAHALGIDRTAYLFEVNSSFGKELATFRANVCKPEAFSCDDWNDYKSRFRSSLQSLDGFKPQLREFNQCLQRRPTANELQDEDIRRFSRSIVTDRISDLASSDRFLRITKEKMPLRSGKSQKNPNYLNPCEYYLWSQGEEPIHDALTTLVYFTAEYRCSASQGAQRMKDAIETSKAMTQALVEKVLRIEGEFSDRNQLETEGYSSPPYERFADVVGSYALAELLTQIPQTWDRQNVFLASSSWQCVEPSLASHFPDESAIENEYIFDSHTDGDQRQKEMFTAPIREAISCQKDFDFKECSIPFKKSN